MHPARQSPPASNRLRARFARRVLQPVQVFVRTEAAGGAVLFAATLFALAWANSPWSASYADLWGSRITVETALGDFDRDLAHIVNEGLMAIFFFVVSLEIKRELLFGELATPRRAALPVAAALGGMAVPALIYASFNAGHAGAAGWGIPMATDIAFALGVLALLGPRVPFALKVFLLALAVVDDLGAILVIALFYTDHVSADALLATAGVLALIVVLGRAGVRSIVVYAVLGACLWLAVLESGIHATIAGVVLALLTPARPQREPAVAGEEAADWLDALRESPADAEEEDQALLGEIESTIQHAESPLERLERQLHPWAAFGILPVFALANAGLDISGDAVSDASRSEVTGGVVLGLLLGKPVGVLLFSWLAVRLRLAHLPAGVSWMHLAGAGVVAGVGFTVSLFITGLAFDAGTLQDEAKLAIVAASAVSGIAGFLLLRTIDGRS